MRKWLTKILQILDGTPAVYGKRQSGQSLVELTLVTPILIILFAGLVEIGWFANNYLILQEVTRVGARSGTTMSGEFGILFWDDVASRRYGYGNFDATDEENFDPDVYTIRANTRDCSLIGDTSITLIEVGFYNAVGCVMRRSMAPLPWNTANLGGAATNTVDDIVISAFSIAVIIPDEVPITPENYRLNFDRRAGIPDSVGHAVVVGRYPPNANECTVNPAGVVVGDGRDPFDFITDGDYNNRDDGDPFDELYDHEAEQAAEYQRGFVWTGNHHPGGNPNCWGSEFTIERVEQLVNLPSFALQDEQRAFLPDQGLVLVEMFWQHSLLLRIPILSPVFDVLGDRTTISVWAAFPLQNVEPNIKFD